MHQRRKFLTAIAPLLVVIGICGLVASAARSPVAQQPPSLQVHAAIEPDSIVQQVDKLFFDKWHQADIEPAAPAEELALLRRLSLVLLGTTPSLEEIRLFEADHPTDRVARWTERMLADRRFADYFAKRFARTFIGTEEGQFVVFRRDRFWTWMSNQLQSNRPYDEIVRDMIADRGLSTDHPEVNFVVAAFSEGIIDHNRLAGRTARAFLGQRIDCAECHDHPYAAWKKSHFEGLAACYGQVNLSGVGVEDNQTKPYLVKDRMTLEEHEVPPAVPFHAEWMPAEGTTRQRLAAWITHPENRRFDRAIVNRIWGLMFGRPYLAPVDDLPDPDTAASDVLDLLATDFREHHRDLKRLISTITATRVFRSSSQHPAFDIGDKEDVIEETWAAFPMTRLRPEQVIGSMLQAASLKTIDQNSHWTSRAIRFFRELDFVKEYGDLGDDELTERSGTIPQSLLRMNSSFAAEWTKSTVFSAAGRIASIAPNDEACLDLCFLVCLTRRPTFEEQQIMLPSLENTRGPKRGEAVEDIFWSLFNGAEFCWEH